MLFTIIAHEMKSTVLLREGNGISAGNQLAMILFEVQRS